MTGYLVVPTLTALTAENQPFEQFWAASCESWAKLCPRRVGTRDRQRMSLSIILSDCPRLTDGNIFKDAGAKAAHRPAINLGERYAVGETRRRRHTIRRRDDFQNHAGDSFL